MQRLLEEELRLERSAHDTTTTTLDETIAKLRAEVEGLTALTKSYHESLAEETAKREEADKETHDDVSEQYAAELAALEQEYKKTSSEAAAVKQNLMKRRNVLNTDLSNKIAEYDHEMVSHKLALCMTVVVCLACG